MQYILRLYEITDELINFYIGDFRMKQIKFYNLVLLNIFLHLILVNTNMSAKNIKNSSDLTQLGRNYLKFMSDAVTGGIKSNDLRLESLFAENLTKFDNRTVLFKNSRQALLRQIEGFKEAQRLNAGQSSVSIDIDNATIIPSSETNSVIVYFEWSHVSIGRATTMVILQCNAEGQIECVIDVWAKVAAE